MEFNHGWTRINADAESEPSPCVRIYGSCDARMVHQREGRTLAREPRDDLPRVHAERADLEGDAAPDGFV